MPKIKPILQYYMYFFFYKEKTHLKFNSYNGVILQVPVPCPEKRAMFYSMKWLIAVSMTKARNRRFYEQLASEILSAYNHGVSSH